MTNQALDHMLHDLIVFTFCQGGWGKKRVLVRDNLLRLTTSRRMWN